MGGLFPSLEVMEVGSSRSVRHPEVYEAFVEFSERLYPSAQIPHLCADYPRAPSLDSPIDSIIDPTINAAGVC